MGLDNHCVRIKVEVGSLGSLRSLMILIVIIQVFSHYNWLAMENEKVQQKIWSFYGAIINLSPTTFFLCSLQINNQSNYEQERALPQPEGLVGW